MGRIGGLLCGRGDMPTGGIEMNVYEGFEMNECKLRLNGVNVYRIITL